MMETLQAKRVLETAILCAQQPLPMRELRTVLQDTLEAAEIETILQEISQDWEPKGLELVKVATGWRFQSKAEMREHLERLHPEKPPKYSRATLETLAIIAYRQPVTRADIEDIRGVAVSSAIVKQLEDRGWIETVGYRPTVGRPALFATTKLFLNDMGLDSLSQLPAISIDDAAELLRAQATKQQAPQYDPNQSELPIEPYLPTDVQAEALAQPEPAAEVQPLPVSPTPPTATLPDPENTLAVDDYLQADLLTMVRGGYMQREDIIQTLVDEILNNSQADENAEDTEQDTHTDTASIAAQWVDAQLQALQNEQNDWPAITDCERLDNAFASLTKQGVICLPNAGQTHDEALRALALQKQAYEEAAHTEQSTEPTIANAYCFFLEQDITRALSEGMLMLSFKAIGDSSNQPNTPEAIAQRILNALRAENLSAQWDGSEHAQSNARICIQPFIWQMR